MAWKHSWLMNAACRNQLCGVVGRLPSVLIATELRCSTPEPGPPLATMLRKLWDVATCRRATHRCVVGISNYLLFLLASGVDVTVRESQTSSALERDASELYDAATAFIRIYQFRDRDHGLRLGLTVVQAYVLDVLLRSDGQSLNGLASALRLDKSTMSRVVGGMTRNGLVEWSRTDEDRRAMRILASADGKKRYERFRRAIVKENARLLASYSAGSRKAAISILRDLTERATSD